MSYHIEFHNPKSQLKFRILMIKEVLQRDKPKYMKEFLSIHPEYNNKEGLDLIKNVMAMVTTNEVLTQRFEAFVEPLKQKQTA